MAPPVQPYGFVANLHALRAAIFDMGLQNMTCRVFALVVTYADKNGECFPSIAKMADKLGISRQAVQKQIRRLVDRGYLKSSPQTSKTNIYRILNPAAGCGAGQPDKVYTPAAQLGCPKRPFKKTDKDTKGHPREERKWGSQRAYYQEKQREAATGVSKNDEAALAAIRERAQQGLPLKQRMEIDLDLQAEAVKLFTLPKQRHDFLNARYTALYRERQAAGEIEAE